MILRLKILRFFLKTAIYPLPILAFRTGWWIWAGLCALLNRPVLYYPYGHLGESLIGALVWIFFAEHYRVTSFDELFRERTGALAAGSACLATSCALLATLYFSRNVAFPRGLLICDLFCLLTLTILIHAGFRVLYKSKAHLSTPLRLLVVGADGFAANAIARLQRLSFAPCEVAGYVRLPGQAACTTINQRIYDLDQISLLNPGNGGIDEVIFALQPAQFSRIPALIRAISHICLPVHAIVDLGEGIIARDKLFQLGNIQMLDLTATPAQSLDYALLKRIFDVCFSSAVLLLTAPLLALIALLIKLTSPGPVFFIQERIGLNGKPFKMYKFRTMITSSKVENATRWTTAADARRTSIGILLRKASLDELPQFINVLKGDMSVVGPRPERPHFVQKFLQDIARYNNRHALKVGITGWAQVNGWRGDTSIEKRIEYDLYYVQNWSFTFDLRIIAMTLVTGLINRNAY